LFFLSLRALLPGLAALGLAALGPAPLGLAVLGPAPLGLAVLGPASLGLGLTYILKAGHCVDSQDARAYLIYKHT